MIVLKPSYASVLPISHPWPVEGFVSLLWDCEQLIGSVIGPLVKGSPFVELQQTAHKSKPPKTHQLFSLRKIPPATNWPQTFTSMGVTVQVCLWNRHPPFLLTAPPHLSLSFLLPLWTYVQHVFLPDTVLGSGTQEWIRHHGRKNTTLGPVSQS